MAPNNPLDSLKHLLGEWKSGFLNIEKSTSAKESDAASSENSSTESNQASMAEWGNWERDLELICNQVARPQEGWAMVLDSVKEMVERSSAENQVHAQFLELALAPLNRSAAKFRKDSAAGKLEDEDSPDSIALEIYSSLPGESISRNHLLAFLSWIGGKEGMSKVVHCLVNDPPKCAKGIPLLFAPLIHRDDLEVDWLFPDLFAAIAQLDLGTAIIDYSNFLYRQKDVRPHPAASRLQPLSQLLATATQQLLSIEQDPRSLGEGPEKVSQVINDSVGLITALCDALALNGDKSVVGKIFPALEVTHRRVKLEAAAALAKLGEKEGEEKLIELAEQAVVRRRVIEYAKELGIDGQIDEKFKTAEAIAETELALWLAHPSQMGVAPYKMEVVDSRSLFWPGFDQPVECFLLKYIYPFQPNAYENVGLVGPITHSFSAPIASLPPEDVYAVFAGWHVQHEEIFAGPASEASIHQQGLLAQLRRQVQDQKLEIVSEELLGCCLGEWALVGRGKQAASEGTESREGWIVVDQQTCFWLPAEAGFEGFDENFAWYLYLGRKLLTEFNGPGVMHQQT